MPKLEPRHGLAAAPLVTPPGRQHLNQPHPPASFRVAADAGPQNRNPGPAAVAHLDPHPAPARRHRHGDLAARDPRRAAVPHAVSHQLPAEPPRQGTGVANRARQRRTRGQPRPARAAPGPSTAPGPRFSTSLHRPPARPGQEKHWRRQRAQPTCTPASAPRVKPGHAASRISSVAVRETADRARRPCRGTDPVRHASVDTATQRPATLRGDTTGKAKRPASHENSQLTGHISQRVAGVGFEPT